uniref:Uncharacterized protein n=1 Tax=Davidia involucrata TaxID=16924 RepID=A0A5B7BI06_DAVIN
MSFIQVTACQPAFNVTNIHNSFHAPSMPCITPSLFSQLCKTSLKLTTGASTYQCGRRLPKTSLKLTTCASTYQHCTPVCLFGGKGKSENENEASPWKSLEKAMGSLKKEQSIEDLLRKQIEKQEYYDDGGSGGNRSGGDGGDSGGSEDEGVDGILDELLQVILATVGFIFLYMYIIDGEDITRLAKDWIKFLFGGKKSIRLSRVMTQWGMFYQRLTRKKEVQKDWLERAIINTPTWFDSPRKYKRILRAYVAETSDQ